MPLEKVEVLRLESGDRIVAHLRADCLTSEEQVGGLKKALEEAFPGHEVLVLVGIDLKVTRGE